MQRLCAAMKEIAVKTCHVFAVTGQIKLYILHHTVHIKNPLCLQENKSQTDQDKNRTTSIWKMTVLQLPFQSIFFF